MAEARAYDDILADQRKERKDLLAKIQKMKHAVPKGDKKKKKEVTAEVTQLLADLDLKHENEVRELKDANSIEGDSSVKKIEGTCVLDGSESLIKGTEKISSDLIVGELINDGANSTEITECNRKLSKAQRRRNKKANMEQCRIKEIAEQENRNLTGKRNMEAEEIKKKLSSRNLVIHEVPSDGNCLYKAVAHQLSVLKLQEITVESLRELTSKYLLSHRKDYMPFLTCPETGDGLSDVQYTKYCEDVATSTAWGGHVEIQALTHVCGYPIEVIQAEGPSIIAGDESRNPKLILSYHRHVYGLGEHYNSVIPSTLE